ncbi:hypothetical protein M5K25_004773 [Dendrobium thyrsiflorum]|uniref:Secreted protein n=1 Tax=Dendrobium thyrsiflorum TaxID=117978 RepID=A0ABD0VFV8_DENTH
MEANLLIRRFTNFRSALSLFLTLYAGGPSWRCPLAGFDLTHSRWKDSDAAEEEEKDRSLARREGRPCGKRRKTVREMTGPNRTKIPSSFGDLLIEAYSPDHLPFYSLEAADST